MNKGMEISATASHELGNLDFVEIALARLLPYGPYGPYGPHDTKPRSKTLLVLIFLYI